MTARTHPAGAVFDRLAPTYDRDFTDSLIGRAQRRAVWRTLLRTFRPHDNLLELNCGTGEDALFLAGFGISVLACDASANMIARAEQRLLTHPLTPPVVFCHLPTERIAELDPDRRFDGAFSNFSGLNCLPDLAPVARDLTNLVRTGGSLVLCLSTRVCLLEILHYLVLLQPRKALRRTRGHSIATLDGVTLPVFYPTLRQIRRAFAPSFRIRSIQGIGVAIPPSYLEPWAQRHPGLFHILSRIETFVSTLPLLRVTGDHILLHFEKVAP